MFSQNILFLMIFFVVAEENLVTLINYLTWLVIAGTNNTPESFPFKTHL